MTELSIEHILILAIVTFVLYHFMNRCNYEKFDVDIDIKECTDIAEGYQPLCGLLGVKKDRCSDYYTESDGKGYFCVPDDEGIFYNCKQDNKICSKSTAIKDTDQYIKKQYKRFIGDRTFIGGACNKCGGCGERLQTVDGIGYRTACKNDNTKWCWNMFNNPKACDSPH